MTPVMIANPTTNINALRPMIHPLHIFRYIHNRHITVFGII
jgi:hypothetical protein